MRDAAQRAWRADLDAGRQTLPVATQTTRVKSFTMLATPATGMPFTHTWLGWLSMSDRVQSPARDTMSRKPGLPVDGMLAKECHSSSGLRLMGIDDPAKGSFRS